MQLATEQERQASLIRKQAEEIKAQAAASASVIDLARRIGHLEAWHNSRDRR